MDDIERDELRALLAAIITKLEEHGISCADLDHRFRRWVQTTARVTRKADKNGDTIG